MPDLEPPKANERDWFESELYVYVKAIVSQSLIDKKLLPETDGPNPVHLNSIKNLK